MKPLRLGALVIAAGLLLSVHEASARPGGGQGYDGGSPGGGGSYSGGGYSGGGYDGGGGDDAGSGLIAYLLVEALELTWNHPLVMLPLWGMGGLLFLGYLRWFAVPADGGDWSVGSPGFSGETLTESLQALDAVPAVRLRRAELERLRESDPAFSTILFEDFVHALFARAHEARGTGALDALAAYLSPAARRQLAGMSDGLTAVEGIVTRGTRCITEPRSTELSAPRSGPASR